MPKKAIFLIFSILLLSISNVLQAQFYNTGQDRLSTHWEQIDTKYFQLVFPEYAEQKAQYFARRLLWAAKHVPQDMGIKVCKIKVLMHFESATSNAMVIWAPKRMEIHTTASQNSYAENWFEQLALHEYRHVSQISALNKGLSKIVGLVFGQMGTSAILGAYIPLWYLEGDAVATETALSQTGRGRKSQFAMPLRAQLLSYGAYSYDKASMGSYRDFIPNHYTLGYHLVTLARKNYGTDFWKNTEDYVARHPFNIVPFSRSIYRQSGLRKRKFYIKSVNELINIWQKDSSYSSINTLIKNRNKYYSSYRFGQMINDSILIALRTGIDIIDQFVAINIHSKKEKKVLTPGYSYFYNISLSDSVLCWSERRYHPRWQQVKYQVIMTYNFRTKKRKQLSRRTNYLFPVLNPKKAEIACIETLNNGNNTIAIISASNGKLLKRLQFDKPIKNLCYDESASNIYFYRLEKKGYSLIQKSCSSGKENIILPPSFNNRDWISVYNDSLYYIDDYNGVSCLFLYSIKTKHTYLLLKPKYGIEAPQHFKDKIIFSNYTSKGWEIGQIKTTVLKEIPIKKRQKYTNRFYTSYITNKEANIQKYPPNDTLFTIKNYSKLGHLINIHSWGPLAINITSRKVNPGLSIMSQNLLSSMIFSAGYEYVLNEKANKYFFNLNYEALPISISLNSSYQERKSSYLNTQNKETTYSWNESTINLQLSEGINLSKGQFYNYLRPSAGIIYQYIGANKNAPISFPINKYIASLQYGLNAIFYRKIGKRDIDPRLGLMLTFNYRHTPFAGLNFGSTWANEYQLYLPGLGKHHSIKLYGAYQITNSKTYAYSTMIKIPRGASLISANNIQSYQINYELPLFYPDLSIGSLIYIKRVKGYLFADYSLIKHYKRESPTSEQKIHSYGLDLRFDMHLLRSIAPLDIGLRSAYLPETNSPYFQFLFNINM